MIVQDVILKPSHSTAFTILSTQIFNQIVYVPILFTSLEANLACYLLFQIQAIFRVKLAKCLPNIGFAGAQALPPGLQMILRGHLIPSS